MNPELDSEHHFYFSEDHDEIYFYAMTYFKG